MKSFLDEFYKIMPKKTCNYLTTLLLLFWSVIVVDFTASFCAKVPKISSFFSPYYILANEFYILLRIFNIIIALRRLITLLITKHQENLHRTVSQ